MKNLSRLRVLLVEDNALDAKAMRRTLQVSKETSFSVEHVRDLASAIEILDVDVFDCVLLDLSLPDSNGLLAVDRVVARAPQTPVVVLTGLDDPTTAVEAVDRGANDFLQKGRATGDVVVRSIRYAVARHHAEIELRTTSAQLRVANDRGRIARDLHDTVVQQLFATGMGLHALAGAIEDEQQRETIITSVDQIDTAIRQLREAIFDLHLDLTDDDTELDDAIRAQTASLGFRPSVNKRNVDDMDVDVMHEVVSVVGEALANVAKHAEATSAEVTVSVDDGWVTAEVIDNGRGVTRSNCSTQPDELGGWGVNNMASRAESLGGRFALRPGPGGGTKLTWSVPARQPG